MEQSKIDFNEAPFKEFKEAAEKVSQMLGIKIAGEDDEDSGFGGYMDGNHRIEVSEGDPFSRYKSYLHHSAHIVTTCGNCGSGSYVDITEFVNKQMK